MHGANSGSLLEENLAQPMWTSENMDASIFSRDKDKLPRLVWKR